MQQTKNHANKDWSLFQCIGGDSGHDLSDEDIVSVVSFDSTGQFLSVGDNFGRVIVFNRAEDEKTKIPEYRFITELRAQQDDFDVLRSEKIEPKIVDIKWVKSPGTSLNFLTASEKNINLCKVSHKRKKLFTPRNNLHTTAGNLEMPISETADKPNWSHTIMRQYPKLHSHTINSLSVNPNGISFMSSDDLSIYLWNIENGTKAYHLFEFKSLADEDLTEVVTSSQFSPKNESLFLFTTNKGARLCDARKSSNYAKNLVKYDEPFTGKRNIFTDYLAYVSGASFVEEGKFVTREPLQTKLWDVRITNRPLETIPMNDGIKTKLAEMFEKDLLMEKFNVAPSPCGKYFATGFFNRTFHLLSLDGSINMECELKNKIGLKAREVIKPHTMTLPSNYQVENRATKLDWNPKHNEIAVPFESSIYIYRDV
jgi:serine/threonine-protein phosphatase 2A regulatory subunit B